MRIVSAVFRIIIGAVFGVACYLVLAPALAALLSSAPGVVSVAVLLVLVALGVTVAIVAGTIRRAFGWAFLSLGLCTLALPLSTMLLAGRVGADMVSTASNTDHPGATLLGAGLGAGLMTGVAAIVGFFLGAIFLIIALVLLLGGRRQVILVDRSTGREVAGAAYDEPAHLAVPPRGKRLEPPAR